jgi:multiple sugar transport system permease protein
VIAIGIGSFVAYGIVQQDKMRQRSIERFVLTLRIAPAILFVIPTYYLSSRLGWLNSHGLLIAIYAFVNIPFAISLLVTFFQEVPRVLVRGLPGGQGRCRRNLNPMCSVHVE